MKGEAENKKERRKMPENRMLTCLIGNVILIAVILYLFRDILSYGVEFDEVYRKSNVFRLLPSAGDFKQAIFSIKIFGQKIPIMFKEYISSMGQFIWLPLLLASDPFKMMRCMYIVYVLLSLLVYYNVISRRYPLFALFTALLIAVNPFYYPYLRYGWGTMWTILTFGIVFALVQRYRQSGKKRYLFLIAFTLGMAINIEFYIMWTFAASLIAFLLVYPKRTLGLLKSWKRDLAMLLGVLLGMWNYVLYNVMNGFPTFMILYNSLFNRDKYNENPIDNKHLESLPDAIGSKLVGIGTVFGKGFRFYMWLFAAAILTEFILLIFLIKQKKLQQNKLYFVPSIVSLLVFAFILITPNATWAHHFLYLAMPTVLTIACMAVLVLKLLGVQRKWPLRVFSGLGAAFAVVLFVFSNQNVKAALADCGTDKFSPAIFDLYDRAEEMGIADGAELLFVDWGMHAQFYFFRRGSFQINNIVGYDIHSEEYTKKVQEYLDEHMPAEFYIPVYSTGEAPYYGYVFPVDIGDGRQHYVSEEASSFMGYVLSRGAQIQEVENFYEKGGQQLMTLFKVSLADSPNDEEGQ